MMNNMKVQKYLSLIVMLFSLIGCRDGSTSCSSNKENNSITSGQIVDPYIDNGDENNMISNPGIFLTPNGDSEFVGIADPFCLRGDDGFYYLYSTQLSCTRGDKGYGFDPGPVFRSLTMSEWEYCGSVFLDVPNYNNYIGWNNGEGGVWAPTVAKIGDNYCFYYTLGAGGYYSDYTGIGVATSPTPYGPWTHYGKLFNSVEIGVRNSIDPYVFSEDGNNYIAWGSGDGIYICELNETGTALKNGIDYAKENKKCIMPYNIYDNRNYEACFIQKKNGNYYMYLSTGSCCDGIKSTYKVVVGKADNIYGPYVGSNGKAIDTFGRGDTVIQPHLKRAMGTGHMAVVQDDKGLDWLVYHGYNPNNPDNTQKNTRTLYIDRLYWTEEGYPICKDTYPTYGEIPGPYIY